MEIRIAILTVSDRSARSERADLSGPAISDIIREQGWSLVNSAIVPDEQSQIEATLREWSDSGQMDLIFTTGGTGFAPRDVTPEATTAVIERAAPGLAEAMRAESLKVTPHAMLSRSVAGIRNRTLIVNLPGSPRAAVENLGYVLAVLPHAVELLQESPQSESGHQAGGRKH